MAVDGVRGKQPINNKHTMESLNIKKGTYEASIFNEIDKSDGKEDGSLSDNQYFVYKTRISIEQSKEKERKLRKLLEQTEKEIQEEMKMAEASLEVKNKYPDATFNKKNNTVTIKSLDIYDFDISTLERFKKLEIKIAEAESRKEINKN